MNPAALLPLLPDLLVEQIIIGDDAVTIAARLSRQETGQPHKFKRVAAARLYTPEEVCQRPFTALQAACLFTTEEGLRCPWQQKYLTRLCESDETIACTYAQVQAFLRHDLLPPGASLTPGLRRFRRTRSMNYARLPKG